MTPSARLRRPVGPRLAAGLLALALVPAALRAEDEATPELHLTRFTDAYTRLELRLVGALPGERDLILRLGVHSDGRVRQAWGHLPGQARAQDQLDPRGLSVADGRLQGVLTLRHLMGVGDHGYVGDLRMDVRIAGTEIAGTYEGWIAPRTGGHPAHDIVFAGDPLVARPDEVRWRHGERTAVRGEVAGEARDAEAAAAGQSFASGQDWPQFGGPNGDFGAAPFDGQLIEDMRDARLVWMSEETPAGRSQVNRYGQGNLRHFLNYGMAGGTASPMIADGRVFLNFVIPATDSTAEETLGDQAASYKARGVPTVAAMWTAQGTDVLLCLDAATGRTLWRAEVPGGRYYPYWADRGHHKGWWGPQVAVADGQVFWETSHGVTWALDAATGETQWARRIGSSTLRTVIDGVLIPSNGQAGYDAATGETRWEVAPAVANNNRAALRWDHDGVAHAIFADGRGRISCVRARDGKELWRIEDSGANGEGVSLAGDVLLANITPIYPRGHELHRAPPRLGAYRIGPEGAERIWELGPEEPTYSMNNQPIVVHDGHVYFRGVRTDGALPLIVIHADTGRIVNRSGYRWARWAIHRVQDILITQVDATHERTELFMTRLDPRDPQALGEVWPTDHSTTSGYWPVPMCHAVADGRIIIRGTRGVFCYDLRKTPAMSKVEAALEAAGDDVAAAIDALDALMDDADEDVRAMAGRELAGYAARGQWDGRQATLLKRLGALLGHADPAVRGQVIAAMPRFGPDAVPPLADAARSPDPLEADAAMRAAAKLDGLPGGQGLEAVIHTGLRDERRPIVLAALEAAISRGERADGLAPTLLALAHSDESIVRRHALRALLVVLPAAEFPLEDVDDGKERVVAVLGDHPYHAAVGRAVGVILHQGEEEALSLFTRILEGDNALQGARACHGLAELGAAARPALGAIEAAREKWGARVFRDASENALQRIQEAME